MNRLLIKRRDFLKGLGLSATGIAFGGTRSQPSAAAPPARGQARQTAGPSRRPASRVSLVKGNDRRQVIFEALTLIEDEIFSAIGPKRILLKPNMAVSKNPLAVTHVDAVRAVLEFLTRRCKNEILIGESGVFNTLEGYRNNGYQALEKEYRVKLIDLNADTYQPWYVFGKEQNPQPVRLISTFLDPDTYIISLPRMKTHDCVLVTLALKNVLMALPLNDYQKSDKGFCHGPVPAGNDILHFNLFHLAHRVWPDLAVIDGFEAMEGDGPAWGTPLETRVALASTDALAADTVATQVMGLDPQAVLYLSAMREAGLGQGDPQKIKLLGTALDQCRYRFKVSKRLAEIYKL